MFEDLITSKTRVKLLNSFLETPSEMYHVRELVRRVSEEINAVRRELLILEKKGILKKEPRANRVYYYLDKSYIFYYDLIALYSKSHGLGANIIKNRVKIGKIKYAMISARFARSMEADPESVDLLVVGTIVLPELSVLVREEEEKRGREINYSVMTEDEFGFRKKRNDPFILSVLSGTRIMLIGDEVSLVS